MKFVKGIIIGSVVGVSLAMMYSDNMHMINKRKVLKRGRQFGKKIGIM